MDDLRALRDRSWARMRSILDRADRERRDLSAAEAGEWDGLESHVASLSHQLEEQQVNRSLEPSPIRGHTPEPQSGYDTAFAAFVRGGLGDLDAAGRQLLMTNYTPAGEARAQGVGTDAGGGYLVPPGWQQRLTETMRQFGNVRGVANTISTDSGGPLEWPTVDDTTNVGAILAENTQATEQDAVFGTKTLGAYTYTSKQVRVSLQLLQDSAFAVDEYLTRALGERIGRVQNQHFTTGTGTAQPLGIVTGATIGKTGATGQTTTVTYDDLVDLAASVDPAYNTGGSAWMAHQGTVASLRKLKDSSGMPLWQPGLQAGQPAQLLGYPVVVNNDMPTMAANAKSVLFGDFARGYVIRDVRGVGVLRLAERYADYLQVGFLAFTRSDATVDDAGAYKAYRNSAT